jgi:hypothetical protein
MAGESVEEATSESGDATDEVADAKPSASLWPMFVAFGLAIAEVGVVLGVFVLTVVGFLAFTGSIAGILHESGYVDDPWRALAVLGAVVLVAGTAVFALFGGTVGGAGFVGVPNAVAYRGLSLVAAGAITLLAAGIGRVRSLP